MLPFLATSSTFAQHVGKAEVAEKVDMPAPEQRTAKALFEEVNTYLDKKFTEFNKQNIPYDAKLETRVKQEKKDLAVKYAAILDARSPLPEADVYYLGMLQHLATDGDAALNSMRRYLKTEVATGENAQVARAVLVLYATQKNLLPEAESAVDDYARNQPQSLLEWFGMETLITEAWQKSKRFDNMLKHAQEMYQVAMRAAGDKKIDSFRRDDLLFRSVSSISEALLQLKNRDAAIAAVAGLRKLAVSLPSGNLLRLANIRLFALDQSADLRSIFDEKSVTTTLPDIVGTQWIDQPPVKFSELRGHVVLLDFWAPWCAPCRYTFPRLQQWHENYKDKGLVILGVTNYFGSVDGKRVTHAEELAYLRTFKKTNRLPYGFVVSDSGVNDLNYGVFTIPMSFLIDRNGKVRYISMGVNDQELSALDKRIKKLFEEAPDDTRVTSSQAQVTKGNAH